MRSDLERVTLNPVMEEVETNDCDVRSPSVHME